MIYMNRPTDSVRIAFFDKSNPDQFLVLTEADDPDNWKLPCGKFNNESETPDDAASREVDEELGILKATELGMIRAGELVNDDGVSARYIYACLVNSDVIKPSGEIAQTRWVTEDTLPESKNKAHMLSAVAVARQALVNL